MIKKLLPLITAVAGEILFLIFFHCIYGPYGKNVAENTEIYYVPSDRMISSVELNSNLLQWKYFEGERECILDPYAYVKVVIKNNAQTDRTYFILNKDLNTRNVLMEFRGFQMYTVTEDYPSVNKSVYRVRIPAETEKTYFMEIKNVGVVAANPTVILEGSFFIQLLKDQVFLWVLLVGIGFFAMYFIAGFLVLKNFSLLLAGIAAVMLDVIYVVQIGVVLPIRSPVFEETMFFTYGLSVTYLVFFLVSTVAFAKSIRVRAVNWITTYVAFIPWFLFGGIDSVSKLLGHRIFYEQIVPMAFLYSVVTYGIFIVHAYNITQKAKQDEILSFFTLNSQISFRDILKEKNIPTQLLIKVRDKLQQPLEIIQAVSSMMANNTDHSKIVAYSAVVSDYVLEMKKILGLEFLSVKDQNVPSRSAYELQKDFEFDDFEKFVDSSICIYGKETEINLSIKVILTGEGFSCFSTDSVERVVDGISKGEIQMMIIEPASDGQAAFDFCREIRGKYNMLEFPILMIINFYANYLVRSGYSAGVNDFVIRPFDGAELVSRCYSLLQLKNVFLHNHELSRQENEKSAFLYFVTHNVNTPLTLLLNRVEEFSHLNTDMDDERREIFRDISDAVLEINEIIQNVLISFRISDGRYVNEPKKIFVEDTLDLIRPAMESKAAGRNVKIIWKIQEPLPQVNCCPQALRGIVTNLIDNAIKYTPVGSNVTVRLALGRQSKKTMILSVSDEGDGITSDKIPLLFSRFEKIGGEKSSGTPSVGLGLFVANELAKMNGILLEYSDALEGGACFTLIFTLDEDFSRFEVSDLEEDDSITVL